MIDTQHGITGLILSLVVAGIVKYCSYRRKKEKKMRLDIRRAFKAIRLIAGDRWPKIREEIMKDEKID